MRGNETNTAVFKWLQARWFTIPMRGNEDAIAGETGSTMRAVYDPHEG